MNLEININTEIEVELTDAGIKQYNCYYKELNKTLNKMGWNSIRPIKLKKGLNKFMLWEFMQIFGNGYYMGEDALTKNNNIILKNIDK